MPDDDMRDLRKMMATRQGRAVFRHLRELNQMDIDELREVITTYIFDAGVKTALAEILDRFAENPFVFYEVTNPDGTKTMYEVRLEPNSSTEFLNILRKYIMLAATSLYVEKGDLASLQAFLLSGEESEAAQKPVDLDDVI